MPDTPPPSFTATLSRGDLVSTSRRVIGEGQNPSGGYVACPTYPTYGFAWLRDGAFCGYAMDLCGESDSTAAFHRFVANTLHAHRPQIAAAIAAAAGPEVGHPMLLPTRYTLSGQIETPDPDEEWPNFQLDGYGTWLWALRDHVRRGRTVDEPVLSAAELAADYLVATRHLPCYDCWEESSDRRHTSTLAAMVAGLESAAELLDRPELVTAATELRSEMDTLQVRDGAFVKHDATDGVDASLLWLALPFGVVAPDDPRMTRAAERISAELVGPSGGVRRYLGDEFYGGGEWLLLTAWLGWYRATTGDRAGAEACRAWIERTATPDGWLPEQITSHPQDRDRVQPWVDKWGPVATPLLWSHAMYLVLDDALR